MKEVEKYVETHFKHYFVNYTLFNGKKILRGRSGENIRHPSATSGSLATPAIYIFPNQVFRERVMHPRYRVEPFGYDYDRRPDTVQLTFRRMCPTGRRPEFDVTKT